MDATAGAQLWQTGFDLFQYPAAFVGFDPAQLAAAIGFLDLRVHAESGSVATCQRTFRFPASLTHRPKCAVRAK